MKRKSMRTEIAALTEEVRRLREEVAALRLCPPVQFVSYVPTYVPYYPQPYVQPYWTTTPQPQGPFFYGDPPSFTITCEVTGNTNTTLEVS